MAISEDWERFRAWDSGNDPFYFERRKDLKAQSLQFRLVMPVSSERDLVIWRAISWQAVEKYRGKFEDLLDECRASMVEELKAQLLVI